MAAFLGSLYRCKNGHLALSRELQYRHSKEATPRRATVP
jgi:hypothetical protein